MCGIAGFTGSQNKSLIQEMVQAMHHRGPDHNGICYQEDHNLGMARLGVIDLANGNQPMHSEDGKVSLVFNGEIYNFRELREELRQLGYHFKTNSDTEVLLKGFLQWGTQVTTKLLGMYAFAVSDHRDRPCLYVFRDPLGTKPLYYLELDGKLYFASEMKALLKNKSVEKKMNPRAIHHYLQLRFSPGPETMMKGIYKLPPGHYMTWQNGSLKLHRYWELTFEKRKFQSEAEAQEEFLYHLRKSVKRRLIADVPVGVYLSGGVDSSVLAALMAQEHDGVVNTFSVGFQSDLDETSLAKATSTALGTKHHEIICTEKHLALLDQVIWHLEEPVGDAIVIPLFLLAQEAKKTVTVTLAGDGADEILGGYLFQKVMLILNQYRRGMPSWIRAGTRHSLNALPHQLLNLAFQYPASLQKEGKEKLKDVLMLLEDGSSWDVFHNLISLFPPDQLASGYTSDFSAELANSSEYFKPDYSPASNDLDQISQAIFRGWLPDNMLMKNDKLTMAHGLECREPYLDLELVQFCNSLPNDFKINGWKEKIILRQTAGKLLSQNHQKRTKKPFFIPVENYLKSPEFMKIQEEFFEDNYLGDIFTQTFIDSHRETTGSFLRFRRFFSLIMLNRWAKQFLN